MVNKLCGNWFPRDAPVPGTSDFHQEVYNAKLEKHIDHFIRRVNPLTMYWLGLRQIYKRMDTTLYHYTAWNHI